MLVRHDRLYLEAVGVDCNADLWIFNNCHTDLLWQIPVQQILILQPYSCRNLFGFLQ